MSTRAQRIFQPAFRFGLGGVPLGNEFDQHTDQDAEATLASAWAMGVRYFDVAPWYGLGLAERRFGHFLHAQRRDDYLLSSKVGKLLRASRGNRHAEMFPLSDSPNDLVIDYTADGVRRSIEDSLQRLGTNRIDIALVHDIGRVTHGDRHAFHWQQLTQGGGLRELETLRREGLVGAIGLGVNEWEVAQDALAAAPLDCVLLAGRYTLLEQGALPFLDRCAADGVGVIIGGPFNSGLLAGQAKYNYGSVPQDMLERARALAQTCAEFDVPLEAAALHFPLTHPAVVSVLAGMRSPQQVLANANWMRRPVPAELWTTLRSRGLLHAGAPLPTTGAKEL